MPQRTLFGHLLAIVIVIIWGLTFVSSKVLLADFTPVEILFDRFVLATVAIALCCPRALKFISLKVELYAALAGFFGITLYFVFENNALIHSSSANVSLIVSTAPLFVALLNLIIEPQKRLGRHFWIGFVVAMSGIALISCGTLNLNLNPLGDVLALGSAVVWGLYSYYVVRLQQAGVSSVAITLKSFLYSVLLTLPLMSDYELKADRLIDPLNLINLLFLALIASALSFYLWSRSVACIGSISTNLYLYAIPVVTAIGAILLIDEEVTRWTILGMFLAIGGMIISQRPWRYHRERPDGSEA